MSEAIDLEPSAIFSTIESHPPLMRSQITGDYIGKEVFWSLTYANASEAGGQSAHLIFRFDPHNVRMVVGDVVLSNYPYLKTAQVGGTFLVRGQIKEIDSLCIALEIKELILGNIIEAAR